MRLSETILQPFICQATTLLVDLQLPPASTTTKANRANKHESAVLQTPGVSRSQARFLLHQPTSTPLSTPPCVHHYVGPCRDLTTVRTTGASRSRSPRFLLHPNKTSNRRLHVSTTMLGHVETRRQEPLASPQWVKAAGNRNNNTNLPESQEWETICPCGTVHVNSHRGATTFAPNPFGWQEWREAT
jgi:hypothetical protein